VAEIEQAGFEGYLLKPVTGEEIIHTLSALWAARQKNIPLPLITRQKLQQENSRRGNAQNKQFNFNGVQILLVEDNSVNQMVTRKILGNYGCLVTSAGNGREAVELVRQRKFDLILMDCLMPEMDGYRATGIITEYQRRHNQKHTPIIAFTANAMKGDEEKCLAAGMDDYISKPLQPEKMIAVMSQWLTAILAERARKDQIRDAERKACLIEPEVLDVMKSMTGDSFIPVLKSYIKMSDTVIPAMSEAIRNKDATTLRREAHSLKSSSMQIGAMQVGDMAGKIERMSLDARFDEILVAFPPIAEMSTRVVSHLTDLIALEIQ
jgi:CheY-like chemotaxis protein